MCATSLRRRTRPVRGVPSSATLLWANGETKGLLDSAISGPISEALRELKFDFDVELYEAKIIKAGNDWTKDKNGQGYLQRIAELSGGEVDEAGLRRLRKEFEATFDDRLGWSEAASGGLRLAEAKAYSHRTPEDFVDHIYSTWQQNPLNPHLVGYMPGGGQAGMIELETHGDAVTLKWLQAYTQGRPSLWIGVAQSRMLTSSLSGSLMTSCAAVKVTDGEAEVYCYLPL